MENQLITMPDATSESAQLMQMIRDMAANPNADVDKMTALLNFKREVLKDQHEIEFNQALARLLKKLPRIKKDGVVEYAVDKARPDGPKKKAFNFATWENVDSVIRPLLEEEGFILSFDSVMKEGGGAVITGTLLHSSGHSRSSSIPLGLDGSGGKNNLQGMGSTLSYGKRYTTFMLLNIVTEGEDDDGVRGGMVFIDEKSVTAINELLEETKADKSRFLQMMEVAEVENILAKDYSVAMNALISKRKKIGGGEK